MFFLDTFRAREAPRRAAVSVSELVLWHGGTQRSVARAYWKGHLQYYPEEYQLVEQFLDKGILAAEGQACAVETLREIVTELRQRGVQP